MKPTIGQFVIIYLKNGTQLSGNVLSWENEQVVLASAHKTVKTVIDNIDENLSYYKIIEIDTEKQILESPKKSHDDISTLAELKQELNNLELEETRKQMSSHQISNSRNTSYGLPNIFKIPSAPKHSTEETTSQGTGINNELQDLFRTKKPNH